MFGADNYAVINWEEAKDVEKKRKCLVDNWLDAATSAVKLLPEQFLSQLLYLHARI